MLAEPGTTGDAGAMPVTACSFTSDSHPAYWSAIAAATHRRHPRNTTAPHEHSIALPVIRRTDGHRHAHKHTKHTNTHTHAQHATKTHATKTTDSGKYVARGPTTAAVAPNTIIGCVCTTDESTKNNSHENYPKATHPPTEVRCTGHEHHLSSAFRVNLTLTSLIYCTSHYLPHST